jgi:hypothetical protein
MTVIRGESKRRPDEPSARCVDPADRVAGVTRDDERADDREREDAEPEGEDVSPSDPSRLSVVTRGRLDEHEVRTPMSNAAAKRADTQATTAAGLRRSVATPQPGPSEQWLETHPSQGGCQAGQPMTACDHMSANVDDTASAVRLGEARTRRRLALHPNRRWADL